MYNRYIRNDNGTYTRTVQYDAAGHESSPPPPPPEPPPQSNPPHPPQRPPQPERSPESRFLDRILGKLHLGDVDSGDMLLLLILFFLFKEEADEELLIAIGLLLIL